MSMMRLMRPIAVARWFRVACLVLACFAGFVVSSCVTFGAADAKADIAAASLGGDGPSSAELSDDGQDYGWLYRKGDYWYKIGTSSDDPNNILFVKYDSRVYDKESYDAGVYKTESRGLGEWLYSGGTICYQVGEQVCLDAIVRGEKKQSTTVGSWVENDEKPGTMHVASNQIKAKDITHVVFDKSVKARFHAKGVQADYDYTVDDPERIWFLNGLFDGCSNLEDIKGLEYFYTDETAAMPRMFAGCTKLEELDLTAFNTEACSDFTDMFEGCSSLITLKLGDGWTQANMGTWVSCNGEVVEGAPATFPVDMYCESGPNAGSYQAGCVIPDGAGVYIASGHIYVRSAAVELLPQSGDGQAVQVATENGALPAFEYTGSAVKPAIELSVDGEQLSEGRDYTVVFEDNVEDGRAQAVITGCGDCFGCLIVPFDIVDTGAYALLYEDGCLVLKAGHGLLDKSVISSSKPLASSMRWFDSHDADPGAQVPWADVADKVTSIFVDKSFVRFKPVTAQKWFAGFTALADVEGLEHIDTSAMASARGMFEGCTSLATAHLERFDSSNLADLGGFFAGCTSLADAKFADGGLAGAVVLSDFFAGCTSLASIDLSSADLRSVEALDGLFRGCTSLLNVDMSVMNASNAQDLSGMFEGCSSLVSVKLQGTSVPKARNFARFLKGCSSLRAADFSGIGAPCVEDLTGFVDGCMLLTSLNLGDIDASGAAGLAGLAADCPQLEELKMGQGWCNARGTLMPLALAQRAYRTQPTYDIIDAGAALPDGVGEYRLSTVAIQLATVVMDSPTYEFTGRAITPKIAVKLGDVVLREGADYTIDYANNVHVGTASATVTGKGAFVGGLVVPFAITERVTRVGDRIVYTKGKVTYTLEVTSVRKSGDKVTGVEVAIVDVRVKSRKVKTLSLPVQCTVGGVSATVTEVGSKLTGVFRNVRTVIIGPNVVVIGARAFAKAKKVKKLIVQSARLKKVKNCLKGSKVKRVETRVYLSDSQRKKYKKMFTKKAGKKGVTFIYG